MAIHGVLMDGKFERVDCDLKDLVCWMDRLRAVGTGVVYVFSADTEEEFVSKRNEEIRRLESKPDESSRASA